MVVVIDDFPCSRRPLAILRARHHHAQRDQVGLALSQYLSGDTHEHIARHHLLPFHLNSGGVQQPESANRLHDSRVAGIAQCLVLHARNLSRIAEHHGRQTARGVKRFQIAQRLGEVHRLQFRERTDLLRHTVPYDQ